MARKVREGRRGETVDSRVTVAYASKSVMGNEKHTDEFTDS